MLKHLHDTPDPPPPKKYIKETPPNPVVQAIPVTSLATYSMTRQDQKDAAFMKRLEDTRRAGNNQVYDLPPMRSVLSYVAQLNDNNQPLWFKSHQSAIINSQNLQFPRMDVLTREYIIFFMQAPRGSERPCGKQQCESERLGGFRCKELLLPSVTDSLPIPNWCIMCQYYQTNQLYAMNLSRKKERDQKDLLHPIHTFMVKVDVEGEYRLDRTLLGDVDCIGVYGPFPVYNCNNYVAGETKEGTKCWHESDDMVFRLTRAV